MDLRRVVPNPLRVQRMIAMLRKAGVNDDAVLHAMSLVPREVFVAPTLATQAYDDACLPIGEQQTISMPSVVATMTAALGLTGREKVLEIGTGCGYQTAVLSKLCRRVYTIERHEPLSRVAVPRLHNMGVTNFTPMVGDGTLGWPEQAPFDAIIVTAAGPQVPVALVDQLKPGGVMVIPVGPQETQQKLVRVVKDDQGQVRQEILGPVAFVPLIGVQGALPTRARG
jgi:protein-L-isoaspartate(D-aspartate) O-methyltransferase